MPSWIVQSIQQKINEYVTGFQFTIAPMRIFHREIGQIVALYPARIREWTEGRPFNVKKIIGMQMITHEFTHAFGVTHSPGEEN